MHEGSTVTLTGAATDPEGQGLTYTWTQVSGPAVTLSDANATAPTFTAPEGLTNSTVQFQLSVSDGTNITVDTVDVTINADNDAPSANAGADQTVHEGSTVTLTGTATDPEGQNLTYSWRQISGPTVSILNDSSAVAGFIAPEGLSNSTAQFEFTVSDGTHTSIDTVAVVINADNDAPTANAGSDQTVDEGSPVVLDGRQSSDPEGQQLTYTWVQVSGPPVELREVMTTTPVAPGAGLTNISNGAGAMTTSFSNAGAGLGATLPSVYSATVTNNAQMTFVAPEGITNTDVVFRLSVSDGTNVSVDTVTIHVNANNDAPSVSAGHDRVAHAAESVSLSATAQDPENQTLTYNWTQLSGPDVTLTDPTSATPSFATPAGNTGEVMVFQIAVSDGTNTTLDTVSIAIENTAPTVLAGSAGTATAGDPVIIGAAASDIDGDQLSFQWTQVSGPTVSIGGDTSQNAFFQAPQVNESTQVVFQVEVSDGTATTSRLVTVTIEPSEAGASGGSNATNNGAQSAQTTPIQPAPEPTPEPQPEPQPEPEPEPEPEEPTLGQNPFGNFGGSATAENATAFGTATSTTAAADDVESGTNDDSTDDGQEDEDEDQTQPDEEPTLVEEQTPVLVAAGSEVDIAPLLATPEGSQVEFQWTQVSGTAVAIVDGNSANLRIQMPETFVGEELVFEVEVTIDGQLTVQEVTVQVQPVEAETRDEAQAQAHKFDRMMELPEEVFEEQRGVGKLWASLFAFSGAGPGRLRR